MSGRDRIRPLIAGAALAMTSGMAAQAAEETVKPVFAYALPNVPGRTATGLLVSYGPGAHSPRHHHAGSVIAYVLSGSIRSENSATGAVRIYRAGDSFFEPPGSIHLISENASATEPASLLAIFVAGDGATLKAIDP